MRKPLVRLRIAFVAIGLVLLTALGLFARSAMSRIAHQRKLRHDVVAERIFDELERELTVYLSSESARPSAAYDVTRSDPSQWAPFVVGYFTVDQGYRVVGRAQLESTRVARIERSLSSVWPAPARATVASESTSDLMPVQTKRSDDKATSELAPPVAERTPETGSEVLKRLNRAGQERSRPRRKSPSPSSLDSDPFAY